MRKNENFTLDVISKIDEDIVNDNLNKRSSLWFSRSTRKVNRLWIPIVAASQSVKGNDQEFEFLMNWVNKFDHL